MTPRLEAHGWKLRRVEIPPPDGFDLWRSKGAHQDRELLHVVPLRPATFQFELPAVLHQSLEAQITLWETCRRREPKGMRILMTIGNAARRSHIWDTLLVGLAVVKAGM